MLEEEILLEDGQDINMGHIFYDIENLTTYEISNDGLINKIMKQILDIAKLLCL